MTSSCALILPHKNGLTYQSPVAKKHQSLQLVLLKNQNTKFYYFLNRRETKPIIPNAKMANVDGSGTSVGISRLFKLSPIT